MTTVLLRESEGDADAVDSTVGDLVRDEERESVSVNVIVSEGLCVRLGVPLVTENESGAEKDAEPALRVSESVNVGESLELDESEMLFDRDIVRESDASLLGDCEKLGVFEFDTHTSQIRNRLRKGRAVRH